MNRMKALVAQYDHPLFKAANHHLKDRVVDIGRVTVPIDDEAPVVDDSAQLTIDDPATVG